MEQHRPDVIKMLDNLWKSGVTFVGPDVHRGVKNCKYPGAWIDTLDRYVSLREPSLYVQFYLDLSATILTKRIIAIDIHRIVGAHDPGINSQMSDMHIIHAIMFKMSVSRMLACMCECVLKSPPLTNSVMAEQAAKLYEHIDTMLKENFYRNEENGKYYAKQKIDVSKIIHEIVDKWLLREAFPDIVDKVNAQNNQKINIPKGLESTRLLAADLSFFGVSHCYWLWLHLTAAGIQTMRTESDFLTMFYAFDLFVFCSQCSSHFVKHRSAFYKRIPYTVHVSTDYSAPEIVHGMHNLVNKETGKELLPREIMSDYKGYWERYGLLDAEI